MNASAAKWVRRRARLIGDRVGEGAAGGRLAVWQLEDPRRDRLFAVFMQ